MSEMINADDATAAPWETRRSEQPMRASDADRHAVVMVLQDAVGRGLLTPGEGSERMADAYAAVYLRDLKPLTGDLPPAPASAPLPSWRTLAGMAVARVLLWLSAVLGSPRRARIAIAVVLTVMLMMVGLGALGLVDGGGPRHGPPGGFGRRPEFGDR